MKRGRVRAETSADRGVFGALGGIYGFRQIDTDFWSISDCKMTLSLICIAFDDVSMRSKLYTMKKKNCTCHLEMNDNPIRQEPGTTAVRDFSLGHATVQIGEGLRNQLAVIPTLDITLFYIKPPFT